MIRNRHVNEFYNDIYFLDHLKTVPLCYRVFLPFMNDNNYLTEEDLALEQMYEEGIALSDINELCQKAEVAAPYWYPCKKSSSNPAAAIFRELFGLEFGSDGQVRDLDEEGDDDPEAADLIGNHFEADVPLRRYCIGIGHYKTQTEGQIHMCVLLDLYDASIVGISFSKQFIANMVELVIHHGKEASAPHDILVHSSQHNLYKTETYLNICKRNHVQRSITDQNEKNKILPLSDFFSDLKQEIHSHQQLNYEFKDLQDGIDWLSAYILRYNLNIASQKLEQE